MKVKRSRVLISLNDTGRHIGFGKEIKFISRTNYESVIKRRSCRNIDFKSIRIYSYMLCIERSIEFWITTV